MGRKGRVKPARLAEKLLTIRASLQLTMEQMIARLDYAEAPLNTASLTKYEKGRLEPPLPLLLRFARIANVYVEVLIDDDLDLPPEIPCTRRSEGTKRHF